MPLSLCADTPAEAAPRTAPREEDASWFALRDLCRPNAKRPAYKRLAEEGFEVFTPLRQVVRLRGGERTREQAPVIPDLVFARSTRGQLDPFVDMTTTLQYRFAKGTPYRQPMTVPAADMDRFMRAVSATPSPRYYLPGEISERMLGRMVRVAGGSLKGLTGRLLSVRGSRKRRVLVDIPLLVAAGVEVAEEFIQFVDEDNSTPA